MPFVPANNVMKADIRQTLYGQRISNTVYFEALSPPITMADMELLAETLGDWWETSLAAGLVDDLTLREVYITDLSTQTSPTYTYVPGTLPQGGRDVPGLPGNVAFCVSFRSAGRGRSSRGRNYIAGLAENDVNGNALNAINASNFVAGYNELLTLPEFDGFVQWVIVSTYENGDPRPSALVQPVVTALATDTTVDSQRRRLTGRGR